MTSKAFEIKNVYRKRGKVRKYEKRREKKKCTENEVKYANKVSLTKSLSAMCDAFYSFIFLRVSYCSFFQSF